jgi:CubicO group peptidase (beta-lactamase class C family)
VLCALALCAIPAAINAGFCHAAPAAAKAGTVPMWQSESPQPLEPALRKIADEMFTPLITSGKHAGVVVGIINGDNRWVVAYGRKWLGSNTPPNADTVYEIGSITKTFTAIALAALAAKGRVSLSDPVGKFLPASVRVPSYQGKKITLENLAVHTSGLPRMPDNFVDVGANPYAAYGSDRACKFLSKCRLKSAPGAKCEYSNFGMGLLGLALSRSRGTSYESMISDLVIGPLGLKDTTITLSPNQRARLAPGYSLEEKGKSIKLVPAANWTMQDCFAGAGALRSTANDMLTYVAANLGLTRTPLDEILQSTHKARFRQSNESSVGLAWQILTFAKDEPNIIWHNGGTAGYSSFIGFCKERKIGVVALANTYSESDVDGAALKLMVVLMHPELAK